MPGSDDYDITTNEEHFYQFCDTNIIILDVLWFMDHEEIIDDWLIANTRDKLECKQGMTLEFASEKEILWFTLRWQ